MKVNEIKEGVKLVDLLLLDLGDIINNGTNIGYFIVSVVMIDQF